MKAAALFATRTCRQVVVRSGFPAATAITLRASGGGWRAIPPARIAAPIS